MTSQFEISALSQTTEKSRFPMAPLFLVGGSLWIIYYLLQLVMGFAGIPMPTPEKPPAPGMPFMIVSVAGICFLGAILSFDIGLLRLGVQLKQGAKAIALVGLVFGAIAGSAAAFSLVQYIIAQKPPQIFGGIGVIGTCLSATFIGWAARRSKMMLGRSSLLLLLIGLLTFPLILLFILPAQWVPAFYTDELPFALSGIAWIVLSRQLQTKVSH